MGLLHLVCFSFASVVFQNNLQNEKDYEGVLILISLELGMSGKVTHNFPSRGDTRFIIHNVEQIPSIGV
jgi:hypothetical protein